MAVLAQRRTASSRAVPDRYAQEVSRFEFIVLTVTGFCALFGLWSAVTWARLVSPQFLPSPSDVATMIVRLTWEPFAGFTLQEHLLSSFARFVLGFAFAVGSGVPLGLTMGWFRWVDDIVSPVFESLRFIAPLAWVPFAALWFGTGIGGPVLIIFSGAFPPCVVNAYRGAKFVEPRLIEASRTLGAGSWRVIVHVLLPGSLPSIIAGLRVGAGLGWQSLVGAELIVAGSGVGYVMVQGQTNLAPAIVISGMIAIGIVGLAIDVVLRFVERRIRARWGS